MNSTTPEPALAPPGGVISNFDDPSNEHAMVIAIMSMYIFLTTVFTLARMWTRFYVHQELWWDDWTMFVGWIGLVGLSVAQLAQLQYGGGVDMWNVTQDDYRQFERIYSDIEIVARLSIFFAKFSILLLYIRIFFPKRTRRTQMWWWIWAVIWFNILYTLALIFVVTLQCAPYGLPFGGVCVNEYALLVSASIINVVSDIAVLLIPLEAVWKLQMNRSRKMALVLVFAFGAFAPLSSIARLGYQIPEAHDANRTKLLVTVNILAMAENVIAIIVGCAPVLSVWFFRLQSRRERAATSKSLTARFWPKILPLSTTTTGQRDRRSQRQTMTDPWPLSVFDADDDHRSHKNLTHAISQGVDEEIMMGRKPKVHRFSEASAIYGVHTPTTTTTIEGGVRSFDKGRGRFSAKLSPRLT